MEPWPISSGCVYIDPTIDDSMCSMIVHTIIADRCDWAPCRYLSSGSWTWSSSCQEPGDGTPTRIDCNTWLSTGLLRKEKHKTLRVEAKTRDCCTVYSKDVDCTRFSGTPEPASRFWLAFAWRTYWELYETLSLTRSISVLLLQPGLDVLYKMTTLWSRFLSPYLWHHR